MFERDGCFDVARYRLFQLLQTLGPNEYWYVSVLANGTIANIIHVWSSHDGGFWWRGVNYITKWDKCQVVTDLKKGKQEL